MAVGVAVAVGLVPAALAQAPPVGAAVERPARGHMADGLRSQAGEHRGVSVAEPVGGVTVNPAVLDGQPIFIRRTTVTAGMTMVEVSTTPFAPIVPATETHAKVDAVVNRPDRPASW